MWVGYSCLIGLCTPICKTFPTKKVSTPTRLSTHTYKAGIVPSVMSPEKSRKSSLCSGLPQPLIPGKKECWLCARWFSALIAASPQSLAPSHHPTASCLLLHQGGNQVVSQGSFWPTMLSEEFGRKADPGTALLLLFYYCYYYFSLLRFGAG